MPSKLPSDYPATAHSLGHHERGYPPAFADYVTENGLPGANIVRNHTTDYGPHRRGTFGFVYRMLTPGEPGPWVGDEFGTDPGSMTVKSHDGESTTLHLSRFRDHHIPGSSNEYYFAVHHPPAYVNHRYYRPIHHAKVRSIEEMRQLLSDFPHGVSEQYERALRDEGLPEVAAEKLQRRAEAKRYSRKQ